VMHGPILFIMMTSSQPPVIEQAHLRIGLRLFATNAALSQSQNPVVFRQPGDRGSFEALQDAPRRKRGPVALRPLLSSGLPLSQVQ
jgi:hypothetical protein